MPARTLIRAMHAGVQAGGEICFRVVAALAVRAMWGVLLAVCVLSGEGMAGAQASQAPSQVASQAGSPSHGAKQSSQVQAKASGPAPSSSPASNPASGPMVMGEDPDSADASSAPAQPIPLAAKLPVGSAAPGTLVLWNPAVSPGEPAAAPPATAAAPASVPLPISPPADAGGDMARQQINNECVDLLKMANDLKAAMDKTNENMLSVAVVRKANEIEALAHHVKDEMRPEVDKK